MINNWSDLLRNNYLFKKIKTDQHQSLIINYIE